MGDLTKEAWEAKGLELFGPDKEKWSFHCPSCGNDMSIARAKAEFPRMKGRGWAPESECIGRYIDTPAAQRRIGKRKPERCDWCAYGLFSGPVAVKVDDRVIHVFDFTGEPFTTRTKEATR